jgi:hypothetical protein
VDLALCGFLPRSGRQDARLNDLQVPVPDLGIPSVAVPVNITWVTIQPRPLVLSILDDLIARQHHSLATWSYSAANAACRRCHRQSLS